MGGSGSVVAPPRQGDNNAKKSQIIWISRIKLRNLRFVKHEA